MEIDLALLADAATIDAAGKLNILGVFDRITTGQFPAQHGRVTLVMRFVGGLEDAGRHEVAIRLKAPGGREMMRLDGQIHLAPGRGGAEQGMKVPHVLNIDGLVFPEAGAYAFDVDVDGEHHVSLPLTVVPLTPGGSGSRA